MVRVRCTHGSCTTHQSCLHDNHSMAFSMTMVMMMAMVSSAPTLAHITLTANVTIHNTGLPRVDDSGRLMDIHDGTILRFEGSSLWHWYGMG